MTELSRWLNAPDPTSSHQAAVDCRMIGTGLWWLDDQLFSRWKALAPSYFWLNGIPGSGKTILASAAVQDVIELCANDPGRVVAFFYFEFNNLQKQDPQLMLRSIVQQLLVQCIAIPPSVDSLFAKCEQSGRLPLRSELLELLRHILQIFPHVYIVVDALDECNRRVELLRSLQQIAEWNLENIHVLLTSRKERDIEVSLSSYVSSENSIVFESEKVDEDIEMYTRKRLVEDETLRRWRGYNAISQEIERTITRRACGM